MPEEKVFYDTKTLAAYINSLDENTVVHLEIVTEERGAENE